MRWKLGGDHADFTGVLNGTITVVDGVVTTEDRLEPAISETIREHFEATRLDDFATAENGEKIYPQGKITEYKLDGAYEGYTGMLNGTYQVINGSVWVDPRLEPDASRIIRESYGAKHVSGPTGEEVKAAELENMAIRQKEFAEADRARMEARQRAAQSDVAARQHQIVTENQGRTSAMTAGGFTSPSDVTAAGTPAAGGSTESVVGGEAGETNQAPGLTTAAVP